MKNPRLEGIVNKFAQTKNISGGLPELYQLFCNYLILKQKYYDINWEFPYESYLDLELLNNIDFDNGVEKSMAIDGCFAIYGKNIIHLNLEDNELDEILSKIENKGTLEIVLIQTKSGKLEVNDISTLTNCLNENFQQQTEWGKFVNFRKKCEELIKKNPKLQLKFTVYYVTGEEIDSAIFGNSTFTVREDALKKAMGEYFWIHNSEDLKISYLSDKEVYELQENQSNMSNIITKTVDLEKMTDEINCDEYGKIRFGSIKLGELMKIIYNPEIKKPNDIYGYNVRGEIIESDINNTISESIKNNGKKFLLLNNGITIIVDKQERKGDSGIYLENIQIVNGCQTSHSILKTCSESEEYNDIQVPIKIIQKGNSEEILGEITYSSNNQNPVQKDNLFSIHPVMFKLEKLYKDFELTNKTKFKNLFFERRQGQYNNQPIEYIDMLAQAKAFISVWKRKPHFAVMYKEVCLDEYKKDMEKDKNFLNKSFIIGTLWNEIEKKIPTEFASARYQIFSTIILFELSKKLEIDDIVDSQNDLDTISEKLEYSWLDELSNSLNIENAIDKVIQIIKGNPGKFPVDKKNGRVHYRKFYPVDTLKIIYNEYIKPQD